jgi:hypothetical protein
MILLLWCDCWGTTSSLSVELKLACPTIVHATALMASIAHSIDKFSPLSGGGSPFLLHGCSHGVYLILC